MGPGLRLELKQSQQLVMTPQLQQAIRLLQLSNLELQSFLEAECERNPLLTLEREHADTAEPGETLGDRNDADKADGATGDVMNGAINGHAPEIAAIGTENLYDTGAGDGPDTTPGHLPAERASGRLALSRGAGAPDPMLEERLAGVPTLREHLICQIGQSRAPSGRRQLAMALIELLDEHGLIRADLAGLAHRLGVGLPAVEAALGLLQACEPTGVGARTLGECLALQLAERDRLDPAMQALLDNIDLLSRGDHKRLRRIAGVDEEDYAEMLAEIRALDPRPCAGYAITPAETVVPDVFVRRAAWGGWTVELNSDTLPRLLFDSHYAATLEQGGAETSRYVAECRASAGWLMKSLDQRARTLLGVATEIVRHQERFFDEGVPGLRPLNLKMLAEATAIHESTASRVTNGKYMATQRGVFELKFFLGNALGGSGGEVAAASVRHRIRALVAGEPPDAVLSDDEIVNILKGEGIDLARRTVAKYRKTLHIPSSVERRRQKAAPADS